MFKRNSSSYSSTKSYETDESGSEKYPNINKMEYYLYDKYKKPIFAKNKHNDQIYAKDNMGNEIYPTKTPFLAKNRYDEFYYATNTYGNEYYPKYKV